MFLSLVILAASATLPYPSVTPAELQSGAFEGKRVKMEATVIDGFPDEMDPKYVFFVLRNSGKDVYAFTFKRFLTQPPEALVGAEVLVWGVPLSPKPGHRYAQWQFGINNSAGIVVTRPAPDPFDAPDISTAENCMPSDLQSIWRLTTRGEVIAVWDGGRSVMIANGERRTKMDLASERTPAVGDRIVASGRPETDLRNLNLSRAIWRKDNSIPAMKHLPPEKVTLRQMHSYNPGGPAFDYTLHGQAIRVEATVRSLPGDGAPGRFACGDGSFDVSVDASAIERIPSLQIGDIVEIDGVAVCECRNCSPSEALPLIRGFLVVPRTPEDIRVTAHAARPLPTAVWYVFGALIASLIGIGLWNRSLNRLAHKRGAELAKEQIARAEADLKAIERTRISVELHDTISQNLTGAAFEIETVLRTQTTTDPSAAAHLNRAASTLESCRNELRNCLWDLRNDALEEKDMDAAVRRTLLPHLKGVMLHVRFNVSRSRLSENTAHALLQIIRELSVNGIRHGGADAIYVAGTLEGGNLLVSVRDNGKGFDTNAAPGVEDGHFGLDGIRNRVERLSGTFEIESAPGHGTRSCIRIPAPQEDGTK